MWAPISFYEANFYQTSLAMFYKPQCIRPSASHRTGRELKTYRNQKYDHSATSSAVPSRFMTALPLTALKRSSSRLFFQKWSAISRAYCMQRIFFVDRYSAALFYPTLLTHVLNAVVGFELIESSYCTVNRGDIYDDFRSIFFQSAPIG